MYWCPNCIEDNQNNISYNLIRTIDPSGKSCRLCDHLKYIYWNELDKARISHDDTYADSEDSAKKTLL